MLKIFLVGMPGSGKTTLGKQLSKKLATDFIDLDEEIEKSEQSSINEIFTNLGEDHFRRVERDALLRTIEGREKFVMATGGGAACFFNNLDEMKKSGLTIFLDVSPTELFNRLKPHVAHRPLLRDKTDNELLKEIEDKLVERKLFYNDSDIVVDGDNIGVDNLIELIKRKIQE